MATIEPRLMHMPNEVMSDLPHNDLPPLHTLTLPRTADRDRPLPPIEPHTTRRDDRSVTDIQASVTQVPALYPPNDDTPPSLRKNGSHSERISKYQPSSAAAPLSLILDQTAIHPGYQLNKIIDDVPDILDDGTNKKRHGGHLVKEDYKSMSLPNPVKKQKPVPQAPAFPPIINGLHEPPPHAALVPSISTFGNSEAPQLYFGAYTYDYTHVDDEIPSFQAIPEIGVPLNYHPEAKSVSQPSSEADKDGKPTTDPEAQAAKAKKRSPKKRRRKWTEEETNHLLLGVSRHGVGKWTTILEDPEFTFDDRTAGDLKDRFRTCCPDELRKEQKGLQSDLSASAPKVTRSRTGTEGHLDKILIDSEEPSSAQHEGDSKSKPRKSRAHRKNMGDLAELGIYAPFKKSHRRERRPFTKQDDDEILEGLEQYGPAWTKIQRDQRFHLSSRQPTDLRDRVRNKYPETYARIEKGQFQVKGTNRNSDVLEPSINTLIDPSLQRAVPHNTESLFNFTATRDDLSRRAIPQALDTAEIFHPGQGLVLEEMPAAPFIGNDMDLSRLLIEDSRLVHMVGRPVHESISTSSSPATVYPDPRGDYVKGREAAPDTGQRSGR